MEHRFSGKEEKDFHVAQPHKERLTLRLVAERLSAQENFENTDVSNLDLAGLPSQHKKFRSVEASNLRLYRKAAGSQAEITTDLTGSDWTDANLTSESGDTLFIKVQAEAATFGFSQSLAARRQENQQRAEHGDTVSSNEMNALFGFNGSGGNFKKTRWNHIDFGGADYGAYFKQADFKGATFEGCDVSGIDLSSAQLEGVLIKDPIGLDGLKIAEKDVLSVAQGLSFLKFQLPTISKNALITVKMIRGVSWKVMVLLLFSVL